MKIPFHRPIFPRDTLNDINNVLESGWVTTGKQTKLFEQKLAEYLNVNHVVALNSCTAALHLGAVVSGLSKNDLFIVPTYTFVSSVEIAEYLGAQPILVDIDPKTLHLDLNQVLSVLNQNGSKEK